MALLGASGVKIGLHNVSSKICVYMDCAYYLKKKNFRPNMSGLKFLSDFENVAECKKQLQKKF